MGIPRSTKQVLNQKQMMMIVKDGHKQAFNPDLGDVTRTLNPSNDFGSSHQIVQCTTKIPITYPSMLFIPFWNEVVPIVTISTPRPRLGYTLTNNGQPITHLLTEQIVPKFKGNNLLMLTWMILVT
jgi:hypothetical protein